LVPVLVATGGFSLVDCSRYAQGMFKVKDKNRILKRISSKN